MGSPVSSVVANLFMEDLEEVAMRTTGQHAPKVWERYVEDVFSIVKRSSLSGLLRHINRCDPQLGSL